MVSLQFKNYDLFLYVLVEYVEPRDFSMPFQYTFFSKAKKMPESHGLNHCKIVLGNMEAAIQGLTLHFFIIIFVV